MAELVETVAAALAAGVNPIAAIREATGYSPEQLAISSGLSLSELAAIEAGDISADSLKRIAAALGWPAGVLAA